MCDLIYVCVEKKRGWTHVAEATTCLSVIRAFSHVSRKTENRAQSRHQNSHQDATTHLKNTRFYKVIKSVAFKCEQKKVFMWFDSHEVYPYPLRCLSASSVCRSQNHIKWTVNYREARKMCFRTDYGSVFTCLCKLVVRHLMVPLSRKSRGLVFACAKTVPTASSRHQDLISWNHESVHPHVFASQRFEVIKHWNEGRGQCTRKQKNMESVLERKRNVLIVFTMWDEKREDVRWWGQDGVGADWLIRPKLCIHMDSISELTARQNYLSQSSVCYF